MRNLDFSSWQALVSTLFGLALVTLIGVGFRLLAMYTIQQRRERDNRQINERLRVLIAAYKTLGGSFTGNLAVDPRHLRDLRRAEHDDDPATLADDSATVVVTGSDRARRVRDAVEAALSDILLLGTEEHVRLAERAAQELVAGRPVHVDALVVALRDFIRRALGLDLIPADVVIPRQGPLRPSASGGRSKSEGGDKAGGRGGGGGGMGGGMGGGGMSGADPHHPDDTDQHRP